jgi:hypothetical protein
MCLAMPCVLAVIPIVGMIWVSATELAPPVTSVVRIVTVFLGATLLSQLLLQLLQRPPIVRSNMLGSALLMMGLYPAARAATASVGLHDAPLIALYLPACLLCGWLAGRLSAEASVMANDVLSIVAGVLVVFIAGLVYRVYVRPGPYSPAVQRAMERLSSPIALPNHGDWRPDVYDLVLDGMGRPDVLERDFQLSLDAPIDALQRLGFTIVSDAHANYVQTQLSLASMLNGDYLDDLAKAEANGREHGPLRDLISGSRVPAAFKRLGYQVEFVGSGYLSSGAFEQADVCDCPQLWFADAEVGTLSLSPLKLFASGWGNRAHYERSLAVFDQFERPRTLKPPRYVFAHVPMPHPPFVADAGGRFTDSAKPLSGADGSFFAGTKNEYLDGYRAQALFALARTVRAVTRILEDGASHGRDVIIVVHGDHGPRLGFDAAHPTSESGQRALPILMAIRWPPGRNPGTNPRSLVNVYRILLAHVFHAAFPPLPDRGYVSSFEEPYRFTPAMVSP